jgi:hypothetical protein
MLYTLGLKSVYESYIDTDPNASKGIGGSVWKTRKQAQKFRDDFSLDFEVYGVEANWDTDTKLSLENAEWRDLTRNAKLIRLG